MKLSEFVTPALVKVPLAATDKVGAITELVDLLASSGLTRARDRLLAAVLERESQRTTGIGRGFAIPHAKCDAVDRLAMAFGRLSTPIDFAAIDRQPVSLMVLLASPTNAMGAHIQALARLSRMVTNEATLDALLSAQDSRAFYEALIRGDGAL